DDLVTGVQTCALPISRLEKAPAESPEQAPRQPDMMARWLQRPPLPPIDTDLAGRYLGYFNQIKQAWPRPAVAATEIANWSRAIRSEERRVGKGCGCRR